MHVALVGWVPCGSGAPLRDARRFDFQHLRDALGVAPVVVVLGSDAIRLFEPIRCADVLDRFGGVALGVRDDVDRDILLSWRAVRAAELVESTEVVERVDRVRTKRPLARLSMSEWLGGARSVLSPGALATLRVLPRLRRFVLSEWCRTVGASRRGLDRKIFRELGHTPGEVLRDYRLGSAMALRRAGHRLEGIATSLGYSSKQSLSRALLAFERRRIEAR